MSPQFVDFDGDGHLDLIAGTFDGSPHLARGSAKGFLQPEHILDAGGQRILVNQFWDYQKESWEETERCDPEGAPREKGQCTSAVAFDWDGDGDLDLLLGDYKEGYLYLRRNEGKPGAHAFAARNELVRAGGGPLRIEGHLATPRLVDWDGDGLTDLLIGSIGDSYQQATGGGVYLFRNGGERGAPSFGAPLVLVERSNKGREEPTRPDSGLYPELVDLDGDGDLDLVVGGYSHWAPPKQPLDEAQRARVGELEAELKTAKAAQQRIFEEMEEAERGHADPAAAKAARNEFLAANRDRMREAGARVTTLQKELDTLLNKPMREPFVWLYENLGASPGSAGAGSR